MNTVYQLRYNACRPVRESTLLDGAVAGAAVHVVTLARGIRFIHLFGATTNMPTSAVRPAGVELVTQPWFVYAPLVEDCCYMGSSCHCRWLVGDEGNACAQVL